MTGTILAPTRGGRESHPNQDRAIALAKERQAKLIFLYVSNIQFLGLTAMPVLVDIETELEEMGEFLLTMAQERAEKKSIHAQAIVRQGVFRRVLKEVIQENDVTTVVLGSRTGGTGFTTETYVRELGEEMCKETGVEFIVLHEGKEIETFCP